MTSCGNSCYTCTMSSSISVPPFHRTTFLWVLYLLLGVFSFMLTMIGPMVPYLQAEFHLDYTMVGLHQSAFAIGMVLTGLVASRILRRFGIGLSLWAGMAAMLVGLTIMAIGQNSAFTLGGILIMSIGGTAALTAIQTTLASNFPGRRGMVLMEANVCASIFTMLVPLVLLAGSLYFMGWRIVLPVMALVLLALASFGIPATRKHLLDRNQTADAGQGNLPRAYWRMWLVIFLGVSVEWSIGFWCMSYLLGLPGNSQAVAAFGTVFLGLAAVLGRFTSSRIANIISERRLLLVILGLILVGFPAYWLRLNIPLTFAGLFFCGFGAASLYPLSLSLAAGRAPNTTAKASSWATIAAGLAIGVAPLALGRLADLVSMQFALWYVPVGIGLILSILAIDRAIKPIDMTGSGN